MGHGSANRLRNLLTGQEYESAAPRRSMRITPSPAVIGGIYEAVQRLGFTGAVCWSRRSASVISSDDAEQIATRHGSRASNWTRSPRPLPGTLPGCRYSREGLRKRARGRLFRPRNSNVPFGVTNSTIHNLTTGTFSFTDYFFAKGIQKVRPDGLMVFISSKGTLDKANSHLREYLHERRGFLGAIRPPQYRPSNKMRIPK